MIKKRTKNYQSSSDSSHRGRFQAQGEKLEKSESWNLPIPPSGKSGLMYVDRLKRKLGLNDLKIRLSCFDAVEDLIFRAIRNKGVHAEIKKSFPVRGTLSERVDVEIRKGSAFVTGDDE